MTLKDMLILQEGLRLKPYRDSVGKLTIGVGRNLDDKGITVDEAHMLLDDDIASAQASLYQALPWASSLDANRKIVLENMVFNMGIGGFLSFQNTIQLIKGYQFEEAAKHMLQSKWAKQVGNRAMYLAKIMETGEQ